MADAQLTGVISSQVYGVLYHVEGENPALIRTVKPLVAKFNPLSRSWDQIPNQVCHQCIAQLLTM